MKYFDEGKSANFKLIYNIIIYNYILFMYYYIYYIIYILLFISIIYPVFGL